MAKQTIDNGEGGLSIRTKLNDMFTEVYASVTSFLSSLSNKADLVNGKVPASQLPEHVDEVVEGELINITTFQVEGVTIIPSSGIQYSSITGAFAGKSYRWGGSQFVITGSDLTLGETSSTAYRGDRGKLAYDHSLSEHADVNTVKRGFSFNDSATLGIDYYPENTSITAISLRNIDLLEYSTDGTNYTALTLPANLPIAVAAGDLYWRITYTSGKTQAFLAITGAMV